MFLKLLSTFCLLACLSHSSVIISFVIAFSVCIESLHYSICLLTFQIMLLDVFIAVQRVFLVVEAAGHGTLSHVFRGYHHYCGQDCLEEWQARAYFQLVMAGMEHLHSQGITHRLVNIECLHKCSGCVY